MSKTTTRAHHKSRRRNARRIPPGYLTVADLAAKRKFSKATLYNDIRARRLPVHKWRGRFVIREADAAALFVVDPAAAKPNDVGDTIVEEVDDA